jgi:hypothetical protein
MERKAGLERERGGASDRREMDREDLIRLARFHTWERRAWETKTREIHHRLRRFDGRPSAW